MILKNIQHGKHTLFYFIEKYKFSAFIEKPSFRYESKEKKIYKEEEEEAKKGKPRGQKRSQPGEGKNPSSPPRTIKKAITLRQN